MQDLINPLDAKVEAEIFAELAETIGISNEQISEIERTGVTTLATLIEISKKFALLQRRLAAYEPARSVSQPIPPTPAPRTEEERKIKKIRKKRKMKRDEANY